MIRLMNSAMMPQGGIYNNREITQEEFAERLIAAHESEKLVSSIGYPQNLDFIQKITGLRLQLSRKPTIVKDGDELLIMKLRYRTDGYKGVAVKLRDFEFFHCTYKN